MKVVYKVKKTAGGIIFGGTDYNDASLFLRRGFKTLEPSHFFILHNKNYQIEQNILRRLKV